jgi:hypothetical protein
VIVWLYAEPADAAGSDAGDTVIVGAVTVNE